MLKSELTGEKVFKSLMKDPEFSSMPKPVIKMLRPYVEHLPELLSDSLDSPVGMKSLAESKLKFFRYCIENDFIAKSIEATPDYQLGNYNREELAEFFQQAFTTLFATLERLSSNTLSVLAQNEVTDEHEIVGELFGFSPEVNQAYNQGSLTISDLLLLQPAVLVGNT